MEPKLDQPDAKPYKPKEKTPWVLVILLLSIIGCVALPFVKLFLGTIAGNEMGGRDYSAHLLIRAFTTYPDTHQGHFPTFRTSEEVTQKLLPIIIDDLSKSDYDEPERRKRYLERLDEHSKEIFWNQSLSGAEAPPKSFSHVEIVIEVPSVSWAFYLRHSPDSRFIVTFANGEKTILTNDRMAGVIGHPVENR